jgi:hypothetical protein
MFVIMVMVAVLIMAMVVLMFMVAVLIMAVVVLMFMLMVMVVQNLMGVDVFVVVMFLLVRLMHGFVFFAHASLFIQHG